MSCGFLTQSNYPAIPMKQLKQLGIRTYRPVSKGHRSLVSQASSMNWHVTTTLMYSYATI